MPKLDIGQIPLVSNYERALNLSQDISRRVRRKGYNYYRLCNEYRSDRYTITWNASDDGNHVVRFKRDRDLMVAYYADGRVEVNHDCPGRDTWKVINRLLPSTMQIPPPNRRRASQSAQTPFANVTLRTEPDITPEVLHVAFLLLDYDPATETFTWKKTGKPAGTLQRGYRKIQIKGTPLYAHVLAAMWPDDEIIRQPTNLGSS